MTEREDIDALAAEYVLGTLDASERASVALRRSREPALEAAVAGWERRLAPLDEDGAEVAPPPGIYETVEARLSPARAPAPSDLGASRDNVVRLQRQVARWRGAAIAASLVAACLALVIGYRDHIFAPQTQSFVAVFQKGDAPPSFLLTIDLASRELTIRPVAAERVPDKTYQLWILAAQLGPAPHSLGLIGDAQEPVRKALSQYDPTLLRNATFGISIEPPGGSPTGRPTGPALHGKLIPATP